MAAPKKTCPTAALLGGRLREVIKVLLALIYADDPQVRARATLEEAIRQAEREIGRKTRASYPACMRSYGASNPPCTFVPPSSWPRSKACTAWNAEALMLNAMVIHQQLSFWDSQRSFRWPLR